MKINSVPSFASHGTNGTFILVFAPTGSDSLLTTSLLSQFGIKVKICQDMKELCREANEDCDMILIAEETLNSPSVKMLGDLLDKQPPWSDIPILVVTSGGETSPARLQILSSLGMSANVGLLERPFRRGTLLSTVDVALRARNRQRQVRQLLSERVEAEAKLESIVQQRTAELRETNAQLETLVYSIAHDLRAPLRSMQGFSKILIEDYLKDLNQEAIDHATRIAKSAETMDALILGLLAYGKTARADIELHPVNVEETWRVAISQFEHDIKKARAEIITRTPLPSVLAHAPTLSQVLANLLGNALKFATAGCAPRIILSAVETQNEVRISVEDNGIGIPPEYHEKVFRVFERLQKNNSDGTGIGLSIVRKGVERMGGKVGLESGPPRIGSLFWITLKKAHSKYNLNSDG